MRGHNIRFQQKIVYVYHQVLSLYTVNPMLTETVQMRGHKILFMQN